MPTPLATLLSRLANQASSHTPKVLGLGFPVRWDVIAFFEADLYPPLMRGQGFLARGNSDPTDPTSEEIAVLALGVDWASFFKYYVYTPGSQLRIPKNIGGNAPATAMVDADMLNAYLSLRPKIWEVLKKLPAKLKLYVCGFGAAAPLAQLTALDLRPSNQGPDNQFPPKTQPPCYCFSAPSVATPSLAAYYKTTVKDQNGQPACFNYLAGSTILAVDQFPGSAVACGPVLLGELVYLDQAKLPTPDVPWLERSGTYYLKTMGGAQVKGPNISSAIINAPTGFKQLQAFQMTELVADAYHQAQHPGSGKGAGNFNLRASVNANGAPFAFIYTYSNTVVVAFRGLISWEETRAIGCNQAPTNGTIVNVGTVNQGISELYNKTTITGDKPLRDALRQEVASVMKTLVNPTLFFTGHGIGGALANLATIDFELNPVPGAAVSLAYTFGATALGDFGFKSVFDAKVGPKSFQVLRIYDKVASALMEQGGSYTPIGTPFLLDGQLPEEDIIHHSLNSYLQLLDPNA